MPIIEDIRHVIAGYKRLPRAAQEIVLLEMRTAASEATPEQVTARGTRRLRQPIGPELEQAILRTLEKGPLRVSEIAQAVDRAVSSTTNAVRKLAVQGLVERDGPIVRLAPAQGRLELEAEEAPLAERKGRRRKARLS